VFAGVLPHLVNERRDLLGLGAIGDGKTFQKGWWGGFLNCSNNSRNSSSTSLGDRFMDEFSKGGCAAHLLGRSYF
jgi:hypothetical protein